jgi:predicted transcriptional regulator
MTLTPKQIAEHIIEHYKLTPDEVYELEWELKQLRIKLS